MTLRKHILIGLFVFGSLIGYSQVDPKDTIAVPEESLAIDTSFNYDELFDDFVAFVDSLLAPRSYFLINVSAASGYFNYKENTDLATRKQLIVSPTIGYYHKSGPGITLAGNFTDYGQKRKGYQFSISPSFDFIQNLKWVGGIAFIKYFTKDSLPFYTTPLQNEINGYVLWRKPWLQPGLGLSYGWGSKKDLKKREDAIRLFLRRRGIIYYSGSTEESIIDFSMIASLRHSFYWHYVLGHKDYIRFTPMLAFSAGTQKYGFNQTTGTYAINLRNNSAILFNSGNVNLDRKLEFQPLSLTFYLKPEYNIGKFFIQPQVIFDYYFPADNNNLSTLFSINGGFMF
jgi:hypothetical protein